MTISMEYRGVQKISGPLIFVEGVTNVGYNELVEVRGEEGGLRRGRVLEINRGIAAVEVFEGTTGLSTTGTSVKFQGKPLMVPLSTETPRCSGASSTDSESRRTVGRRRSRRTTGTSTACR